LNRRFDQLRAVAVTVGNAAALLKLAAIQQATPQKDFASFHSVELVLFNAAGVSTLRSREIIAGAAKVGGRDGGQVGASQFNGKGRWQPSFP
jgi:hypothetical protein